MRWSYISSRLAFLALIWAFFFFAFDPILKWSLIKGMEKGAKAKVEILSVKTSFLRPSLYIGGVAVGSATEEYTNLLEFSELKFNINGTPLLEKKFIVDEASLSGLKFGTQRKTSAKLLFAKKEETPGFISDLKKESKDMAADRLGDIKSDAAKDAKEVQVAPESLSSAKVYEELQKKHEAQYAELSKKADLKEYQARLDSIKAEYAKASGQKDFLKKAKDLAKIQKDFKKLSEDFKTDRKLIEDTAAGLQEGMKAAEAARANDINAVMAKMKMPAMDTQSLAKMLVGPAIADKTRTAMKWLAVARKYMPDRSKKKSGETPARRGRTAHFPKEHSYPAFLIRKMAVAGELGLDAPLDFAGIVEGITTEPRVYGKPLTAAIKGAKAGRALDLKALMDGTGDVLRGDITLKYSGIAVKDLTLGKPDSIGAIATGGTGRFDGFVKLAGENINGNAMFNITGAKITPQADSIKAAPLKTAVVNSMSELSSVGMGVKISGTIKEPVLGLTTDLADKLNNAFKGAFGAELAKARSQAREKVDAALKPYKSRLETLTSSKQKELNDKLERSQKTITGAGTDILRPSNAKPAPGRLQLPKLGF